MTASPRRVAIIAGVAVLIVALVGAGLLWLSADERHDDAVGDLARAAVGCETTLDFARTGTFFIYLETAGTVESVAGDCSAEPGPFELPRGDRPDVRLSLTDPAGQELIVSPSEGIAYDVDPYRGVQIGEVTVEAEGDHVLAVASDEAAVVVAVGGDPDDGTDTLRGAAIAVLIAGLLVAGVLFLLAARRGAAELGQAGAAGAPSGDGGGGREWDGVAPISPPTGPPLRPTTESPPPSPLGPPAAPPGGAEPQRSPWAPPAPRGD